MITPTLNDLLSDEQLKQKEILFQELLNSDPHLFKETSGASYIPENTGDIDSFIDLVAQLIDIDQEDNERKIKLIDANIYKNILEDPDNPGRDLAGVVVFSLEERTPGTTHGGNDPMNRTRREVIPQFRGITKDAINYPDEIVIHKGQWFDNYVSFNLVARTSSQANKMALWFEDLMESGRIFFARKGFVRYYFDKREKDSYLKIGEEGFHVRPLKFYIRTEKVYNITEKTINRLMISLYD